MKANRTSNQTASRWTRATLAIALCCTAVFTAAITDSVSGQEQRRDRESMRKLIEQKMAEAKKRAAASAKKTEKKDEEPKPITAIVGADIYTVTREVIRRGTILIQDGKILDVGQGLEIPKDAKVIDAEGRYISPGFVSISASGVGVRTSGSADKFADGLDPFDRNIKIALGVGITTACVQVRSQGRRRRGRMGEPIRRFENLDPEPEQIVAAANEFNPDFGDPNTSLCKCCGLPILPTEPIVPARPSSPTPQKHAIVKMSWGTLDNMLLSDSAFYHVMPGAYSSGLARHSWRETIAKAKKYLADQAEHEKKQKAGDKSAKPPRKSVSDDILKLVKREIALRTSARAVEDIRLSLDLAKELEYDIVIDDVTEGWVIPDEIAEAGAKVVITPRRRSSTRFAKEDTTGSNIESSRIYESAGVGFAVAALSSSISLNGLAGRDLTSLPLEAAFAVRGGCSEKTALAALTIEPAKMLGLEDRIGSIEKGKDADLLILNGNPLDYRTYVETAFVNGRVAYDRTKDRVYPVYER